MRNLPLAARIVAICAITLIPVILCLVFVLLPRFNDGLVEARVEAIDEMLDVAGSIAHRYQWQADKGLLSPEAAREAAVEEIGSLLFGDGNYFWVMDEQGTLLAHPFLTETIDSSGLEVTDVEGRALFRAMYDEAMSDGRARTDYLWPKPGQADPVPKFALMQQTGALGLLVGAGAYMDDLAAQMTIMRSTVLGFSVIGGVLMLIGSYFLSLMVASPIMQLARTTTSLADGHLDQQVDTSHGAEVGQMAAALERLVNEQREVARVATQVASGDVSEEIVSRGEHDSLRNALGMMVRNLRVQLQSMRQGVDILNSAADTLGQSLAELSGGASQTSTAVNQTLASVEQMRRSAHEAATSADETADGARITLAAKERGSAATLETQAAMRRATSAIDAVRKAIEDLRQHTELIGDVTATVMELADRSQVLSVNAGIEAAHARATVAAYEAEKQTEPDTQGAQKSAQSAELAELGKGFGVVATEMRELALASKKSTGEVRRSLARIAKSAKLSIRSVEDAVAAVERVGERTGTSAAAIAELADSVEASMQSSVQIAQKSQEQLGGISQLADATRSIKQASDHMLAFMEGIHSEADSLSALAQRLTAIVSTYKV